MMSFFSCFVFALIASPEKKTMLAAVLRCRLDFQSLSNVCKGKTNGLASPCVKRNMFQMCVVLHKDTKNTSRLLIR